MKRDFSLECLLLAAGSNMCFSWMWEEKKTNNFLCFVRFFLVLVWIRIALSIVVCMNRMLLWHFTILCEKTYFNHNCCRKCFWCSYILFLLFVARLYHSLSSFSLSLCPFLPLPIPTSHHLAIYWALSHALQGLLQPNRRIPRINASEWETFPIVCRPTISFAEKMFHHFSIVSRRRRTFESACYTQASAIQRFFNIVVFRLLFLLAYGKVWSWKYLAGLFLCFSDLKLKMKRGYNVIYTQITHSRTSTVFKITWNSKSTQYYWTNEIV